MIVVQLSDLHLRPRGLPAYRVAETNALSYRAFEAVRALLPAPDLVVISGDLTDNGLDAEYAELKPLLAMLPCPALCVLGNHDRRETFRAAFPAMAGAGAFVGFAYDLGPLRLIGLDTVTPGASHGELCDARLDAFEAALAARREAPTLVFMHHPPFACGIRHMDDIALTAGRERFASIVAANPQIERVCCGHHHRPIAAKFAGTVAQIAPSVAHQVQLSLEPGHEGAMVMEPPAFLIHALVDGAVVTHQALVERFPGPYPFVLDPDYPGA